MRILKKQAGQTLIETLAALFILVTGITATVGLAIYAWNSSTSIVKQIVATGLAREGVEAVRNMRDTNWLQHPPINTDCYNYEPPNNLDSHCYRRWLGTVDNPNPDLPFCLDPTNNNSPQCQGGATSEDYVLGFDDTNPDFWVLSRQWASDNYGIIFDPINASNHGFYYSDGNTLCSNGGTTSDYCRKIIITKITDPPYDADPNLSLLEVKVRVWWIDRTCPRIDDWDELAGKVPPANCRVELDTYLTNWKNY